MLKIFFVRCINLFKLELQKRPAIALKGSKIRTRTMKILSIFAVFSTFFFDENLQCSDVQNTYYQIKVSC